MANTTADISVLLARWGQDQGIPNELFERAYHRLRRTARRIIGSNNMEADAVLSEVCCRLKRQILKRPPATPREFFKLLNRKIGDVVCDLLKKEIGIRKREFQLPQPMSTEPDKATPSPLDELVALEMQEEFLERIKSLPVREREVYELKLHQGLGTSEIATILKCEQKQARRLLNRAMSSIGKDLIVVNR